VSILGRLWRAIGSVLDSALPVPPEQRDAQTWTPGSGEEHSERRRRRLKLHMLEKRGKGGYR
jgi:hypothetical protein